MSKNDTCAARLPIARYSNPLDEAHLHQYDRSSNIWVINIHFTIIPFVSHDGMRASESTLINLIWRVRLDDHSTRTASGSVQIHTCYFFFYWIAVPFAGTFTDFLSLGRRNHTTKSSRQTGLTFEGSGAGRGYWHLFDVDKRNPPFMQTTALLLRRCFPHLVRILDVFNPVNWCHCRKSWSKGSSSCWSSAIAGGSSNYYPARPLSQWLYRRWLRKTNQST